MYLQAWPVELLCDASLDNYVTCPITLSLIKVPLSHQISLPYFREIGLSSPYVQPFSLRIHRHIQNLEKSTQLFISLGSARRKQ